MKIADTLVAPKLTNNLEDLNVLEGTDAVAVERDGKDYKLDIDALDDRNSAHPYYHFFGYAGDQGAGDGKFFDKAGAGNHAVRGANLSDTQLFSNARFVTTIDPTGGAADSVLRIPALNYDYDGGEKLFIYWLGKATAEGSNVEFMGDGNSATYPGLAFRCTATTGTVQPFIRSTTAANFGAATTTAVLNGSLNSYCVVFDGTNKTYCQWVNETLEPAFASGFIQFNSGNPADSRTTNTFNIGQATPAVAASTAGLGTQTLCLDIIRLPASYTLPTASEITNILRQKRANPGKPILGGAI